METSKKDLGVIFVEKLSFNKHVKTMTPKAYRILGVIFRACKDFRIPESLITLHQTYVRSQIEYCSVEWSPIDQGYIDKMEHSKVQQNPENPTCNVLRFPIDIVVQHCFATNLDTHIRTANSIRTTREVNSTFYPPIYNSNIEPNSPLIRMQRCMQSNHD